MGSIKQRVTFIDPPSWLFQDRLVESMERVASHYDKRLRRVVFNFVSREKIREINVVHLKHDYDTDVITFEYCKSNIIEGDVFLCTDVIRDNAIDLEVDAHTETLRVLFHGLLHLIGFNDKTSTDKAQMRSEEDRCLQMFENENG